MKFLGSLTKLTSILLRTGASTDITVKPAAGQTAVSVDLTLPALTVTDVLVTQAATQALSNKTLGPSSSVDIGALPVVSVLKGGTGATTASAARTNLGLGSAATLNVGTGANQIPQLDGSGKLPSSVLSIDAMEYKGQYDASQPAGIFTDSGIRAQVSTTDFNFTAVTPGSAGNLINITFTDTVTATNEAVVVDGNNIEIQIEDGVSTAVDIATALDASAFFSVLCTYAQTGFSTVNAQGPDFLAGGADVNAGDVYRISVANEVDFGSGTIDLVVGDLIIYDATTARWEKVPGADANRYMLTDFSNIEGTLPITAGGTGQTTANAAFNALAPTQTPNAGKFLTTNGANTSWATVTSNPGTVTSITAGTGLNGGTITSSGTIDLANTAVTPAAYTRANITVDQQGRITAASNGTAFTLQQTYAIGNEIDTDGGAAVTIYGTSSGNAALRVDSTYGGADPNAATFKRDGSSTGGGSAILATAINFDSAGAAAIFEHDSSASAIRFRNLGNTGTISIGAPSMAGASTYTLTLPSAVGSTGQVLTASNGTGTLSWATPAAGNPGTVTSVTAGTGLNGGTITSSGTINLDDTAVTPNAYVNPVIIVDQQGRITYAATDPTFDWTQYTRAQTQIVINSLPANNSYFLISSPSTDYYVWYSVDGGGVDPAVAGRTGIAVSILSTDDMNQIASNTRNVILNTGGLLTTFGNLPSFTGTGEFGFKTQDTPSATVPSAHVNGTAGAAITVRALTAGGPANDFLVYHNHGTYNITTTIFENTSLEDILIDNIVRVNLEYVLLQSSVAPDAAGRKVLVRR